MPLICVVRHKATNGVDVEAYYADPNKVVRHDLHAWVMNKARAKLFDAPTDDVLADLKPYQGTNTSWEEAT